MITAKDISKIIDEHDPRIDAFIENVLLPKFFDRGRTISVPTKVVSVYFYNEVSNKRFQVQMIKRGFSIEEKCDDRPCGDCWFEIRVPPQGD